MQQLHQVVAGVAITHRPVSTTLKVQHSPLYVTQRVRPPSMPISPTTPMDAAQYRFHVHVYSPKDGIRRPTVVDEGNYNFAGKDQGGRAEEGGKGQ